MNGFLPMLYPGNKSKVADVICIVFIFIYAMGYSLGLGPAAWVYSSEVRIPKFPSVGESNAIRSFRPLFELVASTLQPQEVPLAASSFLRSGPWEMPSSEAGYTCSSWWSISHVYR